MKNKTIPNFVVWILLLILLVEIIFLVTVINCRPGRYDAFASCIASKKITFYGAFWCPHCQEQKAEFGKSARLLPYVECSTPDGQDQTPVCRQADIKGYPTWQFADGHREQRTISLEELSTLSGCPLIQDKN